MQFVQKLAKSLPISFLDAKFLYGQPRIQCTLSSSVLRGVRILFLDAKLSQLIDVILIEIQNGSLREPEEGEHFSWNTFGKKRTIAIEMLIMVDNESFTPKKEQQWRINY